MSAEEEKVVGQAAAGVSAEPERESGAKKVSEAKKSSAARKEPKGMGKEEVITAIKGMTVVELAELVKSLENEFGVSAVPVAAAPTVALSAQAEAPAEEEQTEFTVTLKAYGEKKIEVIKALREVTDLGLKQAKDLVEAAPQVVKAGISKEEVSTIKQKLEAAGATVEVK